MLARAARRSDVRAAWQVGVPYRDVPVQTVRIRAGRSPGLPGRRLLRTGSRSTAGGPGPGSLIAAGSLGAAGVVVIGVGNGIPVLGGIGAAVIGAVAGQAAVRSARVRLAGLVASDTLGDMASAVADALAAAGLVARGLDSRSVRIVPQPDGYYRTFLDGADDAAARVFTEALVQLLEPLWDPRWIISRRVDATPATLADTAALLLRRSLPGGSGQEVWHTVPSVFARRRDRVRAFETAWASWINANARALPADDPRAQAVLATHMGEDPFRIETQVRTLWT